MARQKTDPLHVVVYPSNFNDDNGHKMLYVSSNAREERNIVAHKQQRHQPIFTFD